MQNGKCMVCKVAGLLVLVGALNWGLVGFLDFNLVSALFGDMSLVSRVIYALVGVSGLLGVFTLFKACPKCKTTS